MTKKEYAHLYYIEHKERLAALHKIWVANNPDKALIIKKRTEEKHKDKKRERNRKYNLENRNKVLAWKKKWRDNNREKHLEWGRKNRGKCNAYFSAYKHSKRKATPKWADKEEIKKIYEMADFMTRYTGVAHQVDHIYPLKGKTVTGLHTHTNLRVIPAKLNRQKSNKIGYEVYD